jgi:hypothetical protein
LCLSISHSHIPYQLALVLSQYALVILSLYIIDQHLCTYQRPITVEKCTSNLISHYHGKALLCRGNYSFQHTRPPSCLVPGCWYLCTRGMRCHTYNMLQLIWDNGPCRDPRSAQCSSEQTESTMAPPIANPMAGDKTGFWELTWIGIGSRVDEQLRPRQRQDREPKESDAKPQSSAARDQECSPHGHWITSSQASDRPGRFVAEQVFRDLYQVNLQTSY